MNIAPRRDTCRHDGRRPTGGSLVARLAVGSAWLLYMAADVFAQAPPATARPTTPLRPTSPTAVAQQEQDVLVESRWTEPRSLALYEACDRNSDDRLDVLEVRRALVDLQATKDPAVFRRLDTDASGFVEWPEFDARFRLSLDRAGAFRVRPHRPPPSLRDPIASTSSIDPSEQLLGALDLDGDGGLSREEFTDFLVRMAQDPSLADRFDVVDLNSSGRLDLREFAPVLQFVPQVWQQLGTSEELRRTMPPEFLGADRDLNGAIDGAELRAGLGRIHPALARWSARILDAADRTRNGSLGAAELIAAIAVARGSDSTKR